MARGGPGTAHGLTGLPSTSSTKPWRPWTDDDAGALSRHRPGSHHGRWLCRRLLRVTLSPSGEPERIHAAIPAGASILELGAGTGRITHSLLALGHDVVAVDQSAEMLEHIHGADTVCSPIETLALERTFDLVLLMSFVIDVADDGLRASFLQTCRRHVSADGWVILQRKPPEWYDTRGAQGGDDPGGGDGPRTGADGPGSSRPRWSTPSAARSPRVRRQRIEDVGRQRRDRGRRPRSAALERAGGGV